MSGMKDNVSLDEADPDCFEQIASSVLHRMGALEQK